MADSTKVTEFDRSFMMAETCLVSFPKAEFTDFIGAGDVFPEDDDGGVCMGASEEYTHSRTDSFNDDARVTDCTGASKSTASSAFNNKYSYERLTIPPLDVESVN